MEKVRKILLIGLTLLLIISCTDATRSKIGGIGGEYKVEMIGCDGKIVRSWNSSGKVLSEETTDGYYFKEKETGKLIEVSGSIIITKQ